MKYSRTIEPATDIERTDTVEPSTSEFPAPKGKTLLFAIVKHVFKLSDEKSKMDIKPFSGWF